jgi:hypothetical protein
MRLRTRLLPSNVSPSRRRARISGLHRTELRLARKGNGDYGDWRDRAVAAGATAEQVTAMVLARGNPYRWPKGRSGNPDGQSRFYHECRKIAREASPEMMRGLVELAKSAEDERVRELALSRAPYTGSQNG